MSSSLSAPHFHNEEAAYAYVEARVWPDGPICPHCGGFDRIGKMGGKSTRVGAYKCYECRKPFTVKVGTIFEASHVAMHIWLQAIYLIAGSKKGISSNQLHRTLGVTLKTAWFMGQRIREAMRSDSAGLFGSGGGIVEIDETYIGNKAGEKRRAGGMAHKMKVLALVDRNSGQTRSFVIAKADRETILPIVYANIDNEAHVITDENRVYYRLAESFERHSLVHHGKGEYVAKHDPAITTNTIEGSFGIFKRGMRGVYQHCQEKHLHRYLAEFEFRYNNRQALGFNDASRASELIRGVVGKRLTYKGANAGA